jgi:chromosome segregation protein
MLLKSIELQGYKTFAGRTVFEFADAITCIVGPNGSGKSNIADAIRWVLGEQSYSLLRGKKTEDMIFSGSESRSRAGMASSSITFDNSMGWLPIDFSEVAITRRAYRDGNNEYLINKQRVRLRDITELLANSGLSERTYTIIGQGLVDAALALRAEERRRLFEEAAGIGLYRSRRTEAQRRLETTQRNLERVEDILAELRPRLRSLERQARRAEQYDQVKTDLEMLLREWYGFHWYHAQRELSEARDEAQVQDTMLEAVRQEQSELDSNLTIYRDRLQGLRARLGSWSHQLSQLYIQRETITRDLAVSDERTRALVTQQQNTRDELARTEAQIELHQDRLTEAEREVQRFSEELVEAQTHIESIKNAMQVRLSEREQLEQDLQAARQNLTALNNQQTQLQARLGERQAQTERQQSAFKAAQQSVQETEQTLREAEDHLQVARQALERIGAARGEAEEKLETQRQQIDDLVSTRNSIADEQAERKTELARLKAQLDVLEQAEITLTGYSGGAQLLLKSVQDGVLQGVAGALSSQLDVPEAYEIAIASALGEYLDAVLLDADAASEQALELLLDQATRGALLPLDALTPAPLVDLPKDSSTASGMIGIAAELVKAPPKLRPAIDLLLGQTFLVRDRRAARQVLIGQPLNVRAVTLGGEVFYASGPIFAGKSGQASTLSRPRQRREFGEAMGNSQTQFDDLGQRLAALDDQLLNFRKQESELARTLVEARRQEKAAEQSCSQAESNRDRARRQAQWQREQRDRLEAEIEQGETEAAQISGQLVAFETRITQAQEQLKGQQSKLVDLALDDLRSQENHWSTQAAVAERALADARSRQSDRQVAHREAESTRQQLVARLDTLATGLSALEDRKSELKIQEKEIAGQVDDLRALIEPADAEITQIETEQSGLRAADAKARQGLSVSERRASQAQLNLTRKQEALANLRERIEDDFGLVDFEYADEVSGPTPLPFAGMVQSLPRVDQISEGLDEAIKRQRGQLRRMGAINPEAQAEYKEVKERFEFMTAQVEDLNKAMTDIRAVIAELDDLMQREFQKTFEAVAIEFKEIFTRLFGGGSARLVLTDPDDLNDTGIDIEARLPGRRTQGLSLLSGGERSLTATALVFSLLKVSPTPFCVLDEVDAMLDEANVGRFRDLLKELAENTQFIVITHNRNTVQAADVIYGVTMGRDSASQVISLKLDQVADVV